MGIKNGSVGTDEKPQKYTQNLRKESKNVSLWIICKSLYQIIYSFSW